MVGLTNPARVLKEVFFAAPIPGIWHMSDKARKRPWESKWKIDSSLPGGGQSYTFLVNPIPPDGPLPIGVLKCLKRNSDRERRAVFFREVSTLSTLSHPNIPKCIDSNAANWEGDEDLYVVMEFIEGPTLEQHIGSEGPLRLEQAIGFLETVLDAINYCHECGVLHRDVKIDNIVLRDRDPKKPVLVDFGQSFNTSIPLPTATGTDDQLGNRFLALPELQVGNNKRDPRSDLTQAVGVFLYALTDYIPATLLTAAGEKPHQTEPVIKTLTSVPNHQLGPLNQLFETAFSISLDTRFQTIESLRNALNRVALAQPVAAGASYGDRVAKIMKSLAADPKRNQAESCRKTFEQVDQLLRRSAENVARDLGFRTLQSGMHTDLRQLVHKNTYGIVDAVTGIEYLANFTIRYDGYEYLVIVQVPSKAETRQLFRFSPQRKLDWDAEHEKVKGFFLELIGS